MSLQSPESIASATSDIEFFARWVDASHEYIDQLYVKTLRLSILSAFSQTMDQFPDYDASCL